MKNRSVVVMGAGVAGMTVAHELLERGFDVHILERRSLIGGKARSFSREPETHGRKKLRFKAPVEHGFHFFPGFYRNLDDTLKRIEVDARRTVYDSLRPASEELFGFIGRPEISVRSSAPDTVAALQNILGFSDRVLQQGLLNSEDLQVFAQKIWQIATSCRERRNTEYEAVGWRTFVGSLDRSEEYYWYLANGLTRALVAAQGSKASTKTIGDVGLRILGELVRYNGKTDRVLDGPANDVWFDPWLRALKSDRFAGELEYSDNVTVAGILFNRSKGLIQGVKLADGRTVKADYYVSALPVEGLAPLLTADMLAADHALKGIRRLASGAFDDTEAPRAGSPPPAAGVSASSSEYLRWMSGIQFFLRERIDMNAGHQMLLDSPWGLTSISQRQFWHERFQRDLDVNKVGSLLSVEISSWDVPGFGTPKTAAACATREEIAAETWLQVRAALPGQDLPPFEDLMGWFLDDDLRDYNGPRKLNGGEARVNLEPIVVNRAGAGSIRPGSITKIPNFVLAGDYVRTETDLACMEGANESGRRAVNARLDTAGADWASECAIVTPSDPLLTAPLRWMDETRFARNLPWAGWDMGKWIIRGISTAKKVTDAIFGEVPAAAVTTDRVLARDGIQQAERLRLDRGDWDPRQDELAESVARLKAKGAGSVALREAEKVLALTKDSGDFERLRNELAPPAALRSVNNRSDSLFSSWRFFKTGRLHYYDPVRRLDFRKEGLKVPVPFQIYDADALVIHGRADLPYLERQMRGSGLKPVRDQDGKAYVEIWLMDYPDACVGPHQEAAIHVVAASTGRLVYNREDAFGCESPVMNSANKLFTLSILLSDMRAITYGEQLFGIGKWFVDAKIAREGTEKTFSFASRSRDTGEIEGEPFFWGKIRERDGLARKMLSVAALLQSVGTIEVVRDLRGTIKNDVATAAMIGRQTPTFKGAFNGFVEIMADYESSPILTPATRPEDQVQWSRTHEFGRHLDDMNFEPLLLARDRHLRSVLYSESWIHDPMRLAALSYEGPVMATG